MEPVVDERVVREEWRREAWMEPDEEVMVER